MIEFTALHSKRSSFAIHNRHSAPIVIERDTGAGWVAIDNSSVAAGEMQWATLPLGRYRINAPVGSVDVIEG